MTIIAIPVELGPTKKVFVQILLDQCCTRMGMIKESLANRLNHEKKNMSCDEQGTYLAGAGLITNKLQVSIHDLMLSALSTKHWFQADLQISNCKANYYVILGQAMMQK